MIVPLVPFLSTVQSRDITTIQGEGFSGKGVLFEGEKRKVGSTKTKTFRYPLSLLFSSGGYDFLILLLDSFIRNSGVSDKNLRRPSKIFS